MHRGKIIHLMSWIILAPSPKLWSIGDCPPPCLALAEQPIPPADVLVAADGNDSNPGTQDDPLASIQAAQLRVRKLIQAGLKSNITVLLRAGTYHLSAPLVFGPDDSGTTEYSITYAAYPGERVTISGGRRITGWSSHASHLLAAPIENPADFEQLYVNNHRAIRARTPNAEAKTPRWRLEHADYQMSPDEGLPTALTITLAEGNLKDLKHIEDTHIVIFKDWAEFRKQLAEIDAATGTIGLRGPFVRPSTKPGKHNSLYSPERQKGYSCYLEGSPDMIDRPGEWAFDRSQSLLLYHPRRGESADDLVAIAPAHNQLLIFKGTPEKPVANVHFRGLEFAHSKYNLPDRGHDGTQAAVFYADGWNIPQEDRMLPAAIEWRFAQNCGIHDCRITHTGANGVALLDGCRKNRIEGNRVFDTGGNCLMVGTNIDPGIDSPRLVSDNLVTNNWIRAGGQDYPSAVGVWLGFARNCTVSYNRLNDLTYTGISVGWRWNDTPSSAANNKIEYNHISDVMKELGDGGAIYTLGFQPGTIIRGNLIHDVHRSSLNAAAPNNGFFLDEGSKGYLLDKNVVFNTAHSPIRCHKAKGVTLRENVLVYNESSPAVFASPPYDKPLHLNKNDRLIYEGTEIIALLNNEILSSTQWEKVAAEQIAAARKTAGLQRKYRKLLVE